MAESDRAEGEPGAPRPVPTRHPRSGSLLRAAPVRGSRMQEPRRPPGRTNAPRRKLREDTLDPLVFLTLVLCALWLSSSFVLPP